MAPNSYGSPRRSAWITRHCVTDFYTVHFIVLAKFSDRLLHMCALRSSRQIHSTHRIGIVVIK